MSMKKFRFEQMCLFIHEQVKRMNTNTEVSFFLINMTCEFNFII